MESEFIKAFLGKQLHQVVEWFTHHSATCYSEEVLLSLLHFHVCGGKYIRMKTFKERKFTLRCWGWDDRTYNNGS
jgi:hypothetical protein